MVDPKDDSSSTNPPNDPTPTFMSTQPFSNSVKQAYIMALLLHMKKKQQVYWKYAKIQDESNQTTFQILFKYFNVLPEFPNFISKPWNPTHGISLEDSVTPRHDINNMEGKTRKQ